MEPRTIVAAVRERLGSCRAVGQPLDYVTFVPDGEPTLDRDLGETIRGVGALGVPVAVITNGSLAWDAGIRSTLAAAAFVSLKVDTVDSGIWHRLNRPVGDLRLDTVLDGMRAFADHYQGELASERPDHEDHLPGPGIPAARGCERGTRGTAEDQVMSSLPAVSHEHHHRLYAIVDELRVLGDCSDSDCLDTSRLVAARPAIEEIHDGLVRYLIPHMEAVETAVYPVLERLLADSGSMVVMRHDHDQIRHLTAVIGEFVNHPDDDMHRGTVLLMRRALLRLYAVLRTHLAEEELYVPIMEGRLTEAQAAEIARSLDHVAARMPGIA